MPKSNLTLKERLLSKVKVNHETGCWDYTDKLRPDGYAQISIGGKKFLAHRMLYIELIGPIPEGTELDHTCRRHGCIYPWHMDPVPHIVNVLRGLPYRPKRDTCRRGHAMTEENTYIWDKTPGTRRCRKCLVIHDRDRKLRNKVLYQGLPGEADPLREL